MDQIEIGRYIKRRRLELGLTQEQLCEGICDPMTLSRLENGKQMPSRRRLKAFFDRLGLSEDRCFFAISKHEMEIDLLLREMDEAADRSFRAVGAEEERYTKIWQEKLLALEQLVDEDDTLYRQYILYAKARCLPPPEGPASVEEARDMLLEALRITSPRFQLEEINRDLRYTIYEFDIITSIAETYAREGNRRKAIDIYYQLMKYMRSQMERIYEFAPKLSLVAEHYASLLLEEKRYEEAAEIAELGRSACVEHPSNKYYTQLPGLLDILWRCFFHMGEREKCREYCLSAYYIYKALGYKSGWRALEQDAQELLGLKLPI